MSDDLNTSQADNGGVGLSELSAGAEGQLRQFARDFSAEIEKTAPDKRPGLRNALDNAVNELKTGAGSSAFSSTAKDAGIAHRDEVKLQDAMGGAAKIGIGIAQAVTKNPVLDAVNKLLNGDNKGEALKRLGQLAKSAGITEVKGVKLETALTNAQTQSNIIGAVKSLKDNGITGTLYPQDGQILTGGTGPDSKAAFVMQLAVRASANPAERDAVKEMTKPPVKASRAQLDYMNSTGRSSARGATVTAGEAKGFAAEHERVARENSVQLTQAIQTPGAVVPAKMKSVHMTGADFARQIGIKPSLSAQIAGVKPVDQNAKIAAEKLAEERAEAQRKLVEEAKKKEAELIAQNAQKLVQRRSAGMSAVPMFTPKPPGMERMGASQLEQLNLN